MLHSPSHLLHMRVPIQHPSILSDSILPLDGIALHVLPKGF